MQLELLREKAPEKVNRLISRESIEKDLGIIKPETWPPRYNVHKYWGKKPSNVVSEYISYFSRSSDVVIDPFCGSGVTVFEAARLGRKGYGFDLNPFSVRLTNALLTPPENDEFLNQAGKILEKLRDLELEAYGVECEKCGGVGITRSVAFEGEVPFELRYQCRDCGEKDHRAPQEKDKKSILKKWTPLDSFPNEKILDGWQMRKLSRKGLDKWSEIFTSRNYYCAGKLWEEIGNVGNDDVRNWLQITFSSSLAQFTKMIADFKKNAGGPSWKINCYWLPATWQELNVFWYFKNRVIKSSKGILDARANSAPFGEQGLATCTDSRELPLHDKSVDYIFTDPPYGGEGIQYGELSVLWNLWLNESQNLDDEIAFNPRRGLDEGDYALGLAQVFSECSRVLKDDKWMTVTFNNKDADTWSDLMTACKSSNFGLVAAVPMRRSAASLTETTMASAPKSDLILTFKKGLGVQWNSPEDFDLEKFVEKSIILMSSQSGFVNLNDLYDMVMIECFTSFYSSGEISFDYTWPTKTDVRNCLEVFKPIRIEKVGTEDLFFFTS